MSTSDDPMIELLMRWDESRRQGREITPEELVPQDPTLREALRARIVKRRQLEALVDLPSPTVAENRAVAIPAAPTLPGFQVLELIGRGGMGVVYKAKHLGLDRIVAVKMVLAGACATTEQQARFRREAESVARLHHPNIVQIHQVGEEAGCPYLVLEYVGGGCLADLFAQGPLPVRQAAELVRTLADAVAHAHRQNVVHRDLKPANVLLEGGRPNGNCPPEATRPLIPKIADFGLAKRLDADGGYTQTGAVMGTPSYMAPEQAAGRTRDVGLATDIYALGVILYEALTGKPPFSGGTVLETLDQVRHQDPLPPRGLQALVPADLETICLKCLEKEPANRYASAALLVRDLDAFLSGEPISARDLSVYDHVARTIGFTAIDPRFARWSTRTLLISPIPLVVHLLVFLFARSSPHYAGIMIGTTIVGLTGGICFILFGNRTLLGQLPRVQRRHVQTVWISNLLGCYLLLAVVLLTVRVQEPEDLFMVYPIWVVMTGLAMFGLASQAGWNYLSGIAFLATALVMAIFRNWAPLILGALASVNLLFQSLSLRRMSQRG